MFLILVFVLLFPIRIETIKLDGDCQAPNVLKMVRVGLEGAEAFYVSSSECRFKAGLSAFNQNILAGDESLNCVSFPTPSTLCGLLDYLQISELGNVSYLHASLKQGSSDPACLPLIPMAPSWQRIQTWHARANKRKNKL